MGWFDTTARSEAEIEREIAEEIAFHLEQRTRELVEQGMAEGEARIEAERRFGSPERVRAQCRSVQLGERIMLQRVNFVLNLVLAAALAGLGWTFWQSNAHVQDQLHHLTALLEPRAAELAPRAVPEPDPLAARFERLKTPEEAAAFGGELAAVNPGRALDLVRAGWARIADPKARMALLEPFVASAGHAKVVQLLDLAMNDPDAGVRARACEALRSYAWQDFSGRPPMIYHEWYDAVRDFDLRDALEISVGKYQGRLRAAQGKELLRELAFLDTVDLTPAGLRGYDALHDLWWTGGEAGNLLDRAPAWLQSEDAELRAAASRFVEHFRLVCENARELLPPPAPR